MDKFVKRLQSRLSAKGHRFTKDECRTALSSVSATPAEPTEEEMILAFDRLANTVEVETEAEIIPAQTTEISQAQEPAAEIEEPKSEESSLTVPENSSQMTQVPATGISQINVTQAITQAVAQVGAESNSEAVELLTALANELSDDISSVEEMASALVTAYLGKRQNVLASAIGTINNLRSAQTSSFQAGLTSDFFDRKNQSKRQFLNQVQNIFN